MLRVLQEPLIQKLEINMVGNLMGGTAEAIGYDWKEIQSSIQEPITRTTNAPDGKNSNR